MKKALKVILLSVVCLVLIVGIGGYIALTQVDFNNYKALITKVVKNSTGRDLTIGDIKVGVSVVPVIEVRDVTFSNAKWAKNPYMLKAESIDISVAVLPLLHKNFVINNFKVSGAEINLEESADKGANWEFEVENKKEEKSAFKFEIVKSANASEVEVKNVGGDNILSSLDIKKVLLEKVVVNYINKGKSEVYSIEKLELDKSSKDSIDFDFDVNSGQYAGKGVIGALKLLDSKEGYPVKADFNVMGIKTAVDLKLYDIFNDIKFEGKAKATNFLGKNSGFNESLDIAYKGDLKNIALGIRELSIAGNVVNGDAKIDLNNKTPFVKAELISSKINISSFGKKDDKIAFRLNLIKEAKATSLVPNDVVPYDVLYVANADVDIKVGQIVNNKGILIKDFISNISLNNGALKLDIQKAEIADGKLLGGIMLNAKNRQLNVDLNANKINLVSLMKVVSDDSKVFNVLDGGLTDVYVNLVSNSDTYAGLIEGLDGKAVVIVDKSKIFMGNASKLKGNIVSQLLNTLNVGKENDDFMMNCAVVRADFGDKKIKFPNGIVFNADKFTMVADGDINLKNDKLNISIKPFAGKLTETNIAKALSSLVKLTGTIQKPKIGVDSSNAIKTIVGVTAGGPVYLGAQMLVESDGSPCYTALKGTGYEVRFPEPKNVVHSTGEDVGKILNDSVDSVKGATKEIMNLLSGGIKRKNASE